MPSGRIGNPAALEAVELFLAECTRPVVGACIKTDSLHKAYCVWAARHTARPPHISRMAFGKILTQLGRPKVRRRFHGVIHTARESLQPIDELQDFLTLGIDYR